MFSSLSAQKRLACRFRVGRPPRIKTSSGLSSNASEQHLFFLVKIFYQIRNRWFFEKIAFFCTFCDQLSIQYNPKTPQFRRTRDFSKRKFKPEILSCSSEVNRKTICHQNGRRSTRNWSVFNNLNNIYYL